MKGKLDGLAIRVPTPNVSLVDLVVMVSKTTTKEEVNNAFKKYAEGPMKGILCAVEEELVSCDFNGSAFSSHVDLPITNVMAGKMVKVLSWYDNEWGFSSRMVETLAYVMR
jgi:glyceraldehyde-3-phosphate dehydrogenase/erythrose-4-phosphate dehydrogenase